MFLYVKNAHNVDVSIQQTTAAAVNFSFTEGTVKKCWWLSLLLEIFVIFSNYLCDRNVSVLLTVVLSHITLDVSTSDESANCTRTILHRQQNSFQSRGILCMPDS